MSAAQARYHLQRMRLRYQLLRSLEVILGAAGITLLAVAILRLITSDTTVVVIAALLACISYAVVNVVRLGLLRVTDDAIVRFINVRYPQVQDSADLLLREDSDLTTLQQLQKMRSLRQFEALYPGIKLPHHIGRAAAVFIACAVGYVALTAFVPAPAAETNKSTVADTTATIEAQQLPATIREAKVVVTPPAYTAVPPKSSTSFELKIPEGSGVQWTITFTQAPTETKLIFSGKDSLLLSGAGNLTYAARRTFSENTFYQVVWRNADGTRKYSDFYPIEIVKDQPPVLQFEKLPQFTTLTIHDKLTVPVDATLLDDYGLSDAYIIATVSKGSGESVKFREEKLRFDRPQRIAGRQLRASKTIDIVRLGLEPGDELYFYAEGFDNKTPVPNRTRTETFFIALQDTATQVTSADPGLGVDLMPDYFRSQRQIIIDSEKLLKERKSISKEEFNARSNELAHDQKVLRLRYGEFLGEEFESGIGPQNEAPGHDDHDEEEDPTKKYGHVHDTENEHNLVEEKKATTQPAHGHDHGGDDDDPVNAYTHAHDSEEEATFFQQSIRAKLKAAITVMWDAELHLRLYDPKSSLPFQYKALKLLKEVSQDSRIYVHRTGFDPPPLKEEKRLTGELADTGNSEARSNTDRADAYPAIRKALAVLEGTLQHTTIAITPLLRESLQGAGRELSTVAINQPGRYLRSLSLIKSIVENELAAGEQRDALLTIRKSLWTVLPPETASPQARTQAAHPLDQRFLQHMKALKKP